MHTSSYPASRARAAFSLIESLATVAALSSVTAIAIFAVSNVLGNTDEHKLKADVAALNSAIRMYKANGGKIVGSWKEDKIIAELKTIATAESGEKLAGLRSAMLDPRIDFVMETFAEAAQGTAKALWDADNQRFYVAHTNQRGIKEFIFDESLAEAEVGERERTSNLELAVVDDWIWDYEDRNLPLSSAPQTPGNPGDSPGEGIGGGEDPLDLDPPRFSTPGGSHPLPAFDLDVFLTNPNPTGVSTIQYSTSPGVWQAYNGEAISVSPGDAIEAYVASMDPENWNDSEHALEVYSVIPVPLLIDIQFSKHAYTYSEMGGAMIPGIYPPVVVQSGTVSLLNASEIPSQFLNTESFTINQVLPGSETPVTLDAEFTGPIPISLTSFASGTEATFEAVARSSVQGLLDSQTVGASVGIEPTILRVPIVAEIAPPSGPPVAGVRWVEISLDSELGDTPQGARIYYTTDGTDPGDSGGAPTSPTAILYEGPFSTNQPPSVPVTARVYGPSNFEHWFVVSEAAEIQWGLGPGIDFTMTASLSAP